MHTLAGRAGLICTRYADFLAKKVQHFRAGGGGVIWNQIPFETLVIPEKAGMTAHGEPSRLPNDTTTWQGIRILTDLELLHSLPIQP